MPSSTVHYDLVIVGAGPAGCSAAIKASRSGLKTLLIERGKSPGSHCAPKIDVTQDEGIQSILKELNLKPSGFSHRSRWFSRTASFEFTSRVRDLFVLRGPGKDSFDSQGVSRALDAGCEVLFNTSPGLLKLGASGVEQLSLSSKSGKLQSIKPSFVIAADGISSQVFSSFAPHIPEKKSTEFLGFGLMLDGVKSIDEGITHVFFDSDFLPGGYFYLCRYKGNRVSAAIAMPRHRLAGKSPERVFRDFMAIHPSLRGVLGHSKVLGSFAGSSYAGELSTHHFRNVLFAGDSARLLDPLLGYGVNHAIFSGYWAASACAAHGDSPESTARFYEDKLFPLLVQNAEGGRFRSFFDSLTNRDFDSVISAVRTLSAHADIDSVMDNPTAHSVQLGRAFLTNPRALLLLRHFRRMI